ncbi:MAG: hypothetical protein H6891_05415 [Brucellaceae bacterium]|nr:hypothetical protein [Brucellaceae bacterium]
MKIRRIRLVLPPRMRGSAQGDARAIADTLASALAMHGDVHGPLRVEVPGAGRPPAHLRADLTNAVNSAAGAKRREG